MPKNFMSLWIPNTWRICPEAIGTHADHLKHTYSRFSYRFLLSSSLWMLRILEVQQLAHFALYLYNLFIHVTDDWTRTASTTCQCDLLCSSFLLCACWDTCLHNSFLVCAQDGTIKPDGDALIDIVRKWHIAFSRDWAILIPSKIKCQLLHVLIGTLGFLSYFLKRL